MSEETLSGDTELEPEEENLESSSDGSDPEYERKKSHRLTPAEKAEARERFELGQESATSLADRFGITRQSMSKYFKDNNIKYGSRAHELQAAISTAAKAGAAAASERYAEQRMGWIEESRIAAYKDLKTALTVAKKIAVETIQAARPFGTADDDLKAAQRYTRIIKENYLTRLEILDANNVVSEEDLPKLTIDDLTADGIQDFHRLNGVEDQDELDEILQSFEKSVA